MHCVSTRECVSACLRLCVRVFVSVKMRWPDCSAEQRGKTRPRVVRIAPIKKPHKRRTTMHPGWRPLPSQSPSVFLCVCHIPTPPHPTPSAMHTLALPLLTMPKQIWRWEMIHHWPCTAVSAPSYREVGHTKSCLKSLYPYCWKDSASYSWTSPLSPPLSWPEQVPASPGATFWSDSSNNFHVQCTLCERKPRDSLQLYVGVFYSARKGGWQSVKPAMKHVSLCLKELLTHLNQLKLFRFLWRVLPWHDGLNDLFEEALFLFRQNLDLFQRWVSRFEMLTNSAKRGILAAFV